MRHTFHQQLSWGSTRNEIGEVIIGQTPIPFSIPQDLQGPGVGTNPDELLLSSAAGCYIMTLGAMFERSSLHIEQITMHSELDISVTNGEFKVEEIRHHPTLSGFDPSKRKMIERIVHKADERCMISNALKASVTITIHPEYIEEVHS
ncbi:OsmC family protein [Chryseomicrobium palamuruense]|uniref:OsmC family protein n=1 Tax=Chryseomicrobium palamuruense TaxID=682973 RepID=A0ABV8UV68_9BACL